MLSTINHDILLALYSLATSSAVASGLVIFFAQWFPFIVLISVVVYIFLDENENEVVRILVRTAFPTLIVWLTVALIKHFFPSPRPFASDLGITPLISVADPFGAFPSAHAAIFGSLAGTMFAKYGRAGRWYLFGAILIAIARVGAGVHWPGDVLTGIILGLAVGFAIEKLLLRTKINPKSPS